jgi:hypothetical protein
MAMNSDWKTWTRARAAFAATALALLVCGCGGMQLARPDEEIPAPPQAPPGGKVIPVVIGKVTSSVDQPADLTDAVCRYLLDQTATAIDQCGTFLLVDTCAPMGLPSGSGIASPKAAEKIIAPEAAFDVEVIRLEEVLGATVKVGVFSTQKKYAVAEVKVTFRSLTGGGNLESVKEGKSSKGAWGVIAAVDREAMKGQEEWKLDGSMVGLACAEAVRAGVDDLEKQVHFRAKALCAGVEKRLLRPRTERGIKK